MAKITLDSQQMADERYIAEERQMMADLVTGQIREAEAFYNLDVYRHHEEVNIEVINQTHRGATDAAAH